MSTRWLIEDNFTQLHFVHSWVLEFKHHTSSLALNNWEVDRVPSLLVEIQLDVGNLVPRICYMVLNFNNHFLWVAMRAIIS